MHWHLLPLSASACWQAAAVLLVPLVVCAYLFASRQVAEQPEWVEVYAPYGQTRCITLPDGSRVHSR